MSQLYPHKKGDLTIVEAQKTYYRCVKCDCVLNEEDMCVGDMGLVYCYRCK